MLLVVYLALLMVERVVEKAGRRPFFCYLVACVSILWNAVRLPSTLFTRSLLLSMSSRQTRGFEVYG